MTEMKNVVKAFLIMVLEIVLPIGLCVMLAKSAVLAAGIALVIVILLVPIAIAVERPK